MLLRHSLLFRLWAPLSGGLLYGSRLPHRDRELLILRTASNCHADYEWAHHIVIGKQVGLTDEEIERVRNGPTHESWSSDDAILLTAADELHHHANGEHRHPDGLRVHHADSGNVAARPVKARDNA